MFCHWLRPSQFSRWLSSSSALLIIAPTLSTTLPPPSFQLSHFNHCCWDVVCCHLHQIYNTINCICILPNMDISNWSCPSMADDLCFSWTLFLEQCHLSHHWSHVQIKAMKVIPKQSNWLICFLSVIGTSTPKLFCLLPMQLMVIL